MSYTDPVSAGTPSAGSPITHQWGDDVQGDIEYLYGAYQSVAAEVASVVAASSAVAGNPAGRIYMSGSSAAGTFNVNSSSVVAVGGPVTNDFLQGGMTSAGSQPWLYAPTTGWYQVNIQLTGVPPSGGGTLRAVIGVSGTAHTTGTIPTTTSSGTTLISVASDIVPVTAGQYLTLMGIQSGSFTFTANGENNYLSASLVSS